MRDASLTSSSLAQVPEFKALVRDYTKLANWEFGWGILETQHFQDEKKTKVVPAIFAVPLDSLVDYYADCELVAERVEKAAEQLVSRWNSLRTKTALEWKDEICRHNWVGKDKKAHKTIFEVKLSSYVFLLEHRKHPGAPIPTITAADLKVLSVARAARDILEAPYLSLF